MTHCAQAGTLSPRTTEPPVVHKELAEVLANPVIAVVRSAEELAEALTSRVSAIEIRSGDLASLPALIDRVRAARKSVLLYPELIAGLGRDPAAIDFLCGYARPTAIVSTKKQILQKARACGLITIFQIFMIDTQAFETGIQTARRLDCDAVEIMPGAIPHIIREVSSQLPLPVLPFRWIIKLGREYFSDRRLATMPTTPWCHRLLSSTSALRWRSGIRSIISSAWV